jgi:D-3-phosphoglycerate dehydrogenase
MSWFVRISRFGSVHMVRSQDQSNSCAMSSVIMINFKMKKGAMFINTGRGATVNEEALIKALQEGWIAHAALDVLETEPPSHNNPMLSMENVTLTAHVASASARFDEARKRRVGYELSLVLSGMWPVSCVNPSVLQNTALRRWQPVGMDRGPNS